MSDRELMELAAKAAEYSVASVDEHGWLTVIGRHPWLPGDGHTFCWNPLCDDGDSFRIETDMSFSVVVWAGGVEVGQFVFKAGRFCNDPKRSAYVKFDECGGDKRAARRLAAVRAAAAIGREMKEGDA